MPNTTASTTVIAAKTLPSIVAMVAADGPVLWPEGSSPILGGDEEFEVIVDRGDEVDDDHENDNSNGDGDGVLTKVGRYVVLPRSSAVLAVLLGSGAPSFIANCPCRFSQHVSLT